MSVGHIPRWLLLAVVLGGILGWLLSCRRRRAVGWLPLALVAGLIATLGLGGWLGQKATASDLTPKVESAITKAGVPLGAAPGKDLVKGREVTLAATSVPTSYAAIAGARDKVAAIKGLRSVALSSAGRADLTMPHITVDATGTGAVLDEMVPDQTTADSITAAAKSTFDQVSGSLTVVPSTKSTTALRGLVKGLPALKSVKTPKLTLDGSSVSVSGSVSSQSALDAVKSQVTSAEGDAKVDLAGVAVAASAPLSAADRATLLASSVYFANGQITLDDKSTTTLNAAAKILVAHPDVNVTLTGQAGPDNPNPSGLSMRRAEAVKTYLVSQGVSADQLTTAARAGKREAGLSDNDPRYRRVDIEIKEN